MKRLSFYINEHQKVDEGLGDFIKKTSNKIKDAVTGKTTVRNGSELNTQILKIIKNDNGGNVIDLNKINVSNVSDFKDTFANVKTNKTLDFSKWDMSKASSLKSMFRGAVINDFIPAQSLSNARPVTIEYLFYDIKVGNNKGISTFVNYLNTSECKSFAHAFSASKREDYRPDYSKINFSKLDTVNVNDMQGVFQLAKLSDNDSIRTWNTKNVTNMTAAFRYSTTDGNFTWDMSNTINADKMFEGSQYNSVSRICTKAGTPKLKSINRMFAKLNIDSNAKEAVVSSKEFAEFFNAYNTKDIKYAEELFADNRVMKNLAIGKDAFKNAYCKYMFKNTEVSKDKVGEFCEQHKEAEPVKFL